MTLPRDRLIVALDVPSVDEAKALIETLGDSVGVYKIGLELLFCDGFALAQELGRREVPVFVDAKLLDIEATVERATAAIARMGVAFLTVHALDKKTLAAAVRGRGDSALKLLGVTVLTNLTPADLVEQGCDHPLAELVLHRARLAMECGFDGVITSGHEAAKIRGATGPDFLIVTPGVRPQGADTQDQARAVTPAKRDRSRRRLSRGGPADHPRSRSTRRRRSHRCRDRRDASGLDRRGALRSEARASPHRPRPTRASSATCRLVPPKPTTAQFQPMGDELRQRLVGAAGFRQSAHPRLQHRLAASMPPISSREDFGVSRTGSMIPAATRRSASLALAIAQRVRLGGTDGRQNPAEQHHVAHEQQEQDQDHRRDIDAAEIGQDAADRTQRGLGHAGRASRRPNRRSGWRC